MHTRKHLWRICSAKHASWQSGTNDFSAPHSTQLQCFPSSYQRCAFVSRPGLDWPGLGQAGPGQGQAGPARPYGAEANPQRPLEKKAHLEIREDSGL
jgi:hypothetical protein